MLPLPTIIHLDADAFFVSVEQAIDPSLRGKKVAVGGRERGIISSASYEARACGVYTPMPTTRALKICPELILVDHTSGRYGEYSRKLFDLCETLTPLVERRSVDEGFLDATPCGFKNVAEVEAGVRRLQQRIWTDLKITVSFGLAANKLVAAVASKLRKPKGFTVVLAGEERAFLAPLSIGKLPGIGPKTEAALNTRGLRLVSDIQEMSETNLKTIFGDSWRDMLATANGEDDSAVVVEHEDAKSYSQQETFFTDVAEFAEIERVAKRMLHELMPKVRADRKRVRTLTVKVRYPNFEQTSAGHSLAAGSDLEAPFHPWIAPLLKKAWSKRRPLRLVSVRLSGIDDQPEQLDLFATSGDARRKRLATVVDDLNARRSAAAVVRGAQLKNPGE